MQYHPLTIGDMLTIAAILALLIGAVCHAHIATMRTKRDTTATREQELTDAVNDAWREYVSVILTGYSNRDARAHLRAYVYHRYAFDDDTLRMINRVAIVRARNHLMQHGAHDMANDIPAINPNT